MDATLAILEAAGADWPSGVRSENGLSPRPLGGINPGMDSLRRTGCSSKLPIRPPQGGGFKSGHRAQEPGALPPTSKPCVATRRSCRPNIG